MFDKVRFIYGISWTCFLFLATINLKLAQYLISSSKLSAKDYPIHYDLNVFHQKWTLMPAQAEFSIALFIDPLLAFRTSLNDHGDDFMLKI